MPEIEIEDKIKNFWDAKSKLVDIEEEQKLDEIIEGLAKHSFINPTNECPVLAFEMAAWLDPKPLRVFFRPSYRKFSRVERRLDPRIRFVAAMCLSKAPTVMAAYREMISGEYQWLLGFSEVPTYELLREFVNERIGTERLCEFFDFVLSELVQQAKELGVVLGRRVGQDATDTHSLKFDKEAKYSGYYKHSGYKVDVVHDLDDPTVPLYYTPMHLTEDEGENLISAQQHLREIGCPLEEHKVDGSYVSYKTIAYSETHRTRLIYRIQDGWVYNDKGAVQNVKGVYQRYHNYDGFRPGADLTYMLQYLFEKDEYEVVGAYHRNLRMEYAKSHPDEVKKETGERSGKTEGFFSVTKGTTLLDSRPVRRGWKEFMRRCGLSMLAHLFAALIRVQHGVTEKLGCLTHIT